MVPASGTLDPMQLVNVDHVGIAVHDLDAAIDSYRELFGVEPIRRETVEDQGVDEAMIPLGGSFVQLLAPLRDDTPVGRFLAARGEGLHHVAYAVADLPAALSHLEEHGADLIDRTPRVGGGGHQIAFVHPKTVGGTLIELVALGD